jgi:O-antigen ligase
MQAAHRRQRAMNLYRMCVLGLILIALTRLNLHLGLEKFRLALLFAGGAMALAVFKPQLVNMKGAFRYWPSKALIGLLLLACLSALFGLSFGASAQFIIDVYSRVIILYFLIVIAIRGVDDLKFFAWAYVASCGILAYYALMVFDLRGGGDQLARLGGIYSYDSNDIGCILMTGLPLAILLFQTSKTVGRVVSGLTLLGIGATVALSGSRGTFLGLCVVGGCLLFLVPGVSAVKRISLLVTVGTGLAIFAPAGYWEQMTTILEPKADYNWTDYYGRRETAKRAFGYMLGSPAFGVGINNFSRAEGTISNRAQNWEYVSGPGIANKWRAAHNSYLQAGAELGVPGLILWTSLLFGGIVGLRRLWKRIGPSWARGDPDRQFVYLAILYLRISIIGFAATSFFVSFAWIDPVYIMIALVVGIYSCVDGASRRAPQPRIVRPVPRDWRIAGRGANAKPI